jgi:molybdopterin-containing oxidoreductase family iron-sulfur binding subunit
MEKCSFCVQRIQEGKLTAKKENRPLKDGDVVTACQTACPTNAIVFGDKNDKASVIATKVVDKRAFGVIEEIHTMPNVTYLTKVRNREEAKA